LQTFHTSRSSINAYNNAFSSSSSSLLERNNNQILEIHWEHQIDVSKEGVLSYINAYVRFYHLYEGESEGQEQDLLNDNNDNKNKGKKIITATTLSL